MLKSKDFVFTDIDGKWFKEDFSFNVSTELKELMLSLAKGIDASKYSSQIRLVQMASLEGHGSNVSYAVNLGVTPRVLLVESSLVADAQLCAEVLLMSEQVIGYSTVADWVSMQYSSYEGCNGFPIINVDSLQLPLNFNMETFLNSLDTPFKLDSYIYGVYPNDLKVLDVVQSTFIILGKLKDLGFEINEQDDGHSCI